MPVPVSQPGLPGRRAALLAIGAVVAVVGIGLLGRADVPGPGAPAAPEDSTQPASPTAPGTPRASAVAVDETPASPDCTVIAPTGGTPLPDIAGALPGDDGMGPLPLGSVDVVPDDTRLDFLFGLDCFRDAHWIDPRNPNRGSGVWTAGRPFHVREGFISSGEPLGEGFDVVLYVTRLEGDRAEPTYRYTSDYVVRGTSSRCGPTYRDQDFPHTCEWFVHDFPDGLPEGRFAIWAVWEAPCRAWVELGIADSCADPDVVISLFSSGFDAPYGQSEPEFVGVSS